MVLPVYDLGCFAGIGAGPLNKWSNLHLRLQVWVDALAGFFHRAGQTKAWWDTLDPVVASSQVLAQRLLWGPRGIVAIALAALCVFALRRAGGGEVSVVARLAATALGVLFLGQLTAFHGVETTHWLRDHLVEFTSAFDGGGSGGVDSDVEARQLRYRTWQAALIGDADSPVAQEYGPKFLDCFGYRWDDPQTADKQTEKQQCIHTLMDDLAAKHPVESEYAHGAKTSEQWFTTGLGFWWGSLPVALWRIAAGLCGIALFMAATLLIPAISFLAPIAFFKAKEVLWPLFNRVASLLLFTVGCQVVAQIVAGAEGALLGAAAIPWLLRLVFCVAVVVVFWIFGRSLRRPLNGWGEKKAKAVAGHTATGALKGAEFAAAIAAGVPPSITEDVMGKVSKKFTGKGAKGEKQGAVAADRAVEQSTPSWVAPRAALPAAGRTAPSGRPAVAWEHAATGPAAGPGVYRRADGTWAGSDRGTTPVAALGPGRFALPTSSGQVHDPAIHGDIPDHVNNRDPVGRAMARHAAAFPHARDRVASVGELDRQLTGMYVAEGRDLPVIDVGGWIAPASPRSEP
jgi:hypothetical protein